MKKSIKVVLVTAFVFFSVVLLPNSQVWAEISPLTENSFEDICPQINDNGYVVWVGFDGEDNEIFLHDGTTATQLTNNSYEDTLPQINAGGYVVWVGFDGEDNEIFLYDGTTATPLTNNSYDDTLPQINADGYVVWNGFDGEDNEIFLYTPDAEDDDSGASGGGSGCFISTVSIFK